MIVNSLFPTASTNGTEDVGYTSGQFTCERTALCNSVDVDMSTFASAYYIGWANPNNLPKAFWLSHCYETETEYVFECIEPSENFMIGFCTLTESVTHAGYRQYTGQTAETAALNNARLINDLYPEFVGATATNYDIILFFIGFFSEPGSLHVNQFNSSISNVVSGSEKINNYNQWLRYKNGEFKLKFNAPGQYGTYEIGYSDISSTGRIVTTTSTGVNVTLYYKGFSLNGNRRYDGTAASGWNIMPFIVQQGSFEDTSITGGKEFRAVRGSYYNNWAAYYQPLNGNTPGVLHPTGYDAFGVGYDNCVIKKEDIPMGGMNIFDYVDYTTMLLVRTSAYNYQFFPVGDINDIDAFFGLLPRLIRIPNSSDVPSYQEGLTYAPDVSANDEFLCRIKSGNISDENFKAGLRKWQYVDLEEWAEDPTKPQGIQENEFEEEDAPEYDPNPPGPEPITPDTDPEAYAGDLYPLEINPGDHKDEGDVPFNLNVFKYGGSGAFITHYILSANQVKTLGQLLWSTMENAAYLRNYATINEGSNPDAEYYFTNSNILDYFISLRFYPKSAGAIFGAASQGTGIKVGKGVTAYNVSAVSAAYNVGYIPAGSVTIPRITNTFVDFEPYTSITLYIPFCGTIELQPSTVMGRQLTLEYLVDISTGTCTAYVYTTAMSGDRIPIATVNGTMGFDVLMTSNNAMTVSARAEASNNVTDLNIAQSLTGSVMDSASALISGNKSGNRNTVVGAFKEITGGLVNTAFEMAKKDVQQPTIMGLAPMKCGNFVSASALGYKVPFVQIRRHPIFNNGNGYKQVGYISDKEEDIGSLPDGTYFSVINPDLSGINLTEEEKSIIKNYLINGCFK